MSDEEPATSPVSGSLVGDACPEHDNGTGPAPCDLGSGARNDSEATPAASAQLMWNEYRRQTFETLYAAVQYAYGMQVAGDIIEFGTMTGETAEILAQAIFACDRLLAPRYGPVQGAPKSLWLLDSFVGLPQPEAEPDRTAPHVLAGVWAATSCRGIPPDELASRAAKYLPIERIRIVEGWYADTVPKIPATALFACIHVDCDLYASTLDALAPLFARGQIAEGAIILFDDWSCNRASPLHGQRKAWEELVSRYRIRFSDDGQYGLGSRRFTVHGYAPPATPRHAMEDHREDKPQVSSDTNELMDEDDPRTAGRTATRDDARNDLARLHVRVGEAEQSLARLIAALGAASARIAGLFAGFGDAENRIIARATAAESVAAIYTNLAETYRRTADREAEYLAVVTETMNPGFPARVSPVPQETSTNLHHDTESSHGNGASNNASDRSFRADTITEPSGSMNDDANSNRDRNSLAGMSERKPNYRQRPAFTGLSPLVDETAIGAASTGASIAAWLSDPSIRPVDQNPISLLRAYPDPDVTGFVGFQWGPIVDRDGRSYRILALGLPAILLHATTTRSGFSIEFSGFAYGGHDPGRLAISVNDCPPSERNDTADAQNFAITLRISHDQIISAEGRLIIKIADTTGEPPHAAGRFGFTEYRIRPD